MPDVERFTVKGLTVRIQRDEEASDPRKQFDHVGRMFCWHRRYELGDEQPDYPADEFFLRIMQEREAEVHPKYPPDDLPDEHVQRYIDKHFHVLPLYLYDHSGLTMNTSGFSCGWDSGQVGWIVMSKDKADKEGIKDPLACLRMEVAEYDQYLRGDVYGYMIEDADGVLHDSCWGFYGLDHCIEEATSCAEADAEWLDADFAI